MRHRVREDAGSFFEGDRVAPAVRGRFITVEGIDGAGKTTIVRRIGPELRKRGYHVVLTTEPTRTWLGDAVKRSFDDDVGPLAETFLFLADRARHTEQIRSWLAQGAIVLCDRYADSTFAYQGARLRGIVKDPIRWLTAVSAPAVLEPDLTILLEIPPRLGLRRIAGRKRKVRFEKEPFLALVAENYRRLARSRRFARIDGSRTAMVVARDAMAVIERRLGVRGR
jgi:dTMP kinase